tara:strand:- start:169 stop:273 length:105 start_codon:yes stop_codon:yes gene_type:complete
MGTRSLTTGHFIGDINEFALLHVIYHKKNDLFLT